MPVAYSRVESSGPNVPSPMAVNIAFIRLSSGAPLQLKSYGGTFVFQYEYPLSSVSGVSTAYPCSSSAFTVFVRNHFPNAWPGFESQLSSDFTNEPWKKMTTGHPAA